MMHGQKYIKLIESVFQSNLEIYKIFWNYQSNSKYKCKIQLNFFNWVKVFSLWFYKLFFII